MGDTFINVRMRVEDSSPTVNYRVLNALGKMEDDLSDSGIWVEMNATVDGDKRELALHEIIAMAKAEARI